MSATRRMARVMQRPLSPEGYERVTNEWRADDALAARGAGAGRGPQFGGPLLHRGDRRAVANRALAVAMGWAPRDDQRHDRGLASLADAQLHRRSQPRTPTERHTVRPLGDIERDAFALVNWLDADQQRAAILGNSPIEVVLGPGQDGKKIAPKGCAARMSADQRAGCMRLIDRYTGLANAEDAATRTAEIEAALDETLFAWSGPTTPGSATYFRVTGPTIVIEYAAQGPGAGGAERRATFTGSIAIRRTTTAPATFAEIANVRVFYAA